MTDFQFWNQDIQELCSQKKGKECGGLEENFSVDKFWLKYRKASFLFVTYMTFFLSK